MIHNTKYKVEKILNVLGGLPEECSWIDYKEVRNEFNNEIKQKIKKRILAFANSIQSFGMEKYIIFGIKEDKRSKEKIFEGIGKYKFPDDNEWQNLLDEVLPFRPLIETGTLKYHGVMLGYIFISSSNYNLPYYFVKEDVKNYWIRHGSKTDDMTESENKILIEMKTELESKGRIYPKSDILYVLTILGQYNPTNTADITLIEKYTDRSYNEIVLHCAQIDNTSLYSEKSLYSIGDTEAISVTKKNERLLQFSSDELFDAKDIILDILKSENVYYSRELLNGVVDTLCFMSNNGFNFISNQIIESVIDINFFENQLFNNVICILAEAAPGLILKKIVENQTKLHKCKNCAKVNLIQALRVIAWLPEYYVEATMLLNTFKDKDLYELFYCTPIATAASFKQKIELINQLDDNLVFDILIKVLDFNPKAERFLSQSYTPGIYKRLYCRKQTFNYMQLQEYYKILIKSTGKNVEKILALLPDWLKPFPFSNLELLADHIDEIEPTITCEDERQKLWNRLCNTPLIYITDAHIEPFLKDRLISVGNKFMPTDKYSQYQRWFRPDIVRELCLDGSNYETMRIHVFEEQKKILLTIFKESGINELVKFIKANDIKPFELSQMLLSQEFSLSIEDDNALVIALVNSPNKFYSYFENKSYSQGLTWIKSLDIRNLSVKDKITLFTELYTRIDSIKYFESLLGQEIALYWEKFDIRVELDEVKQYAFKKLIDFGFPKKAFDLLNSYGLGHPEPLWLFNAVMKQDDYDTRYINIYDFSDIYSYLSNKLEDEQLENLEILSFKLYSYEGISEVKPRITFKKIVNDPSFVVKMILVAIRDRLGLYEQILRYCDEKPHDPISWTNDIAILISSEKEEDKNKIQQWVGYILFNCLNTNDDGCHLLDSSVATILENCQSMRMGFYKHAFSPYIHSAIGSYCHVSNQFKILAETLKKQGYTELSFMLFSLAEKLNANY